MLLAPGKAELKDSSAQGGDDSADAGIAAVGGTRVLAHQSVRSQTVGLFTGRGLSGERQ